jgi:DNA-binding transcriptional regulator LsrR (DeoR family)
MSGQMLVQVARLYYQRDLTKQEIGRRLGLSRFKVARLLEQARDEGVVRIEVTEPVGVADELARELEARFSLAVALVVAEDEIAAAAAGLLPDLLGADDVLGVSWGQTVSGVVDALPKLRGRTPVVQICGAVPGLEPRTGPTEVAVRAAERTGGPLYPLPAPAFASRSARDELLAHETIRPTVRMFRRVSVGLVGIGARPGGGHILTHAFDPEGRTVETELAERAIAIPAARLRSARTVGVAGGERKRRAVRGAVRSGLLSVLVTDPLCAEAVLA